MSSNVEVDPLQPFRRLRDRLVELADLEGLQVQAWMVAPSEDGPDVFRVMLSAKDTLASSDVWQSLMDRFHESGGDIIDE